MPVNKNSPPPPFNVAMFGGGPARVSADTLGGSGGGIQPIQDAGGMSPAWQDWFNIFYNKTIADLLKQVADLQVVVDDLAETVANLVAEQRRNGISASSTIPTAILEQTNNGASVTVKMIEHFRRYDDGLEVTVAEQSINAPYGTVAGFYYDDLSRAGGAVALQYSTDLKTTRANYVEGRHNVGVITCMASTDTADAEKTGTSTAAGSWVNAANGAVADGQFATQVIAGVTTSPNSLITANYGAGVPVGATVKGIEIHLTGYASDVGIEDVTVRLQKAGVSVGTNKAVVGTSWPLSNVARVYGGPLDLWGTTWTVAEVNAANFGVEVNAKNVNAAARTALIDAVTLIVYYETASTTEPPTGGILPPGWPADIPLA